MVSQSSEQIIQEGIKDLPAQALAEIANFVLFVRWRVHHPGDFNEELYQHLIRNDLKQLDQHEGSHLDKEFEAYEQQFPRE